MSAKSSPLETHEVINQVPPLQDYNVFTCDRALQEGVSREGATWARDDLSAFGKLVGAAETIEMGALANTFIPELHTHDRMGNRIDLVKYHPAYHALMTASVQAEIHALPWNTPRTGAHVARAAKHFLMSQAEAGHLCPITMTFAVVPALRHQPDIAEEWVPRAITTTYDPQVRPAEEKAGCILGMFMTEKQGGSDVRANTTEATPLGKSGPGEEYHLTGHKWFCSAPMSDAFLTLAQSKGGLSCFLVPQFLPDKTRNVLRIQRLKDKLGNRSNASSEIEFMGTWGRMLGEEGRGVRTIIEMVSHTRLDCLIGSSGLMRQGLTQALYHCARRETFGKRLTDHPLMQNVLADLALESEAATTLMLRLARGYDEAQQHPARQPLIRILTAIGKYWICKRGPAMLYEAMECHGGPGYVEEHNLARLYREIPVNSIWEGSGNIMCLDVLRAMQREPECIPALREEFAKAKGQDKRYDAHLSKIDDLMAATADLERNARYLVEHLALGVQAALLIQHAPEYVADAFCAARLHKDAGHLYGTLPSSVALEKLLERATPQLD